MSGDDYMMCCHHTRVHKINHELFLITIVVQSSITPTSLSRIPENNGTLPSLNDRLAAYIKSRQQLESKTASIKTEVREFKYLYSYLSLKYYYMYD